MTLMVQVCVTWVIECALFGCILVISMKSVAMDQIASEDMANYLGFFARLYEIWPRPVTWEDQGHRRLGHWMHLTRLYFGTNMKSVGEIAFEIWPIIRYLLILRTFDLDRKTLTFRSRSLALNLVFECALFGCTLVPSMKSVGNRIQNKVASCLAFYPFWGNFDLDLWPWLYEGQGHRPLSHWMRLNRLYLGTKYEVCRWNSIGDIASSLVFYPFWGNLTLTFDLHWRSRSSLLTSLNAHNCVVLWYQVWSLWMKYQSRYRPLFSFLSTFGHLTLTCDLDPWSRSLSLW